MNASIIQGLSEASRLVSSTECLERMLRGCEEENEQELKAITISTYPLDVVANLPNFG